MIQFQPTRYTPSNVDFNEMLGFIPLFLNEADPRPAREQLDENYAHGGGWRPFTGFKLQADGQSIRYPGDPIFRPLAEAKFREQIIRFYECSWLAIFQPDGTFEISRMD